MDFKAGHIEGVVVKDLVPHVDKRGWLTELFRSDETDPAFLPAMAYVSSTASGMTRGPHEHSSQADFFCFVGPSTFRIYCWDGRKHSKTFGNMMVFEAGERRPASILVPPGVVHAYKNVGSSDGWSLNMPNRLYGGRGRTEAVDEIRYENDVNSPYKVA